MACIITRKEYLDNNFENDKFSKELLSNLFSVQQRPFVIISEHIHHDRDQNHLVISVPVVPADYFELNAIKQRYLENCSKDGIQVFLERKYGTQESFEKKLNQLNEILCSHDINLPILYSVPESIVNGTETEDPHFDSSLVFSTLLYDKSTKEIKVVGDLWLSFMFSSFITERSTMIDVNYQSQGIGQISVKNVYELVLGRWVGKPITLINYEKKTLSQKPNLFDGVISYVDYGNFKSLGNNLKSGNVVLEIGYDGMVVFRGLGEASIRPSFPHYHAQLCAIVRNLYENVPHEPFEYARALRDFETMREEVLKQHDETD